MKGQPDGLLFITCLLFLFYNKLSARSCGAILSAGMTPQRAAAASDSWLEKGNQKNNRERHAVLVQVMNAQA